LANLLKASRAAGVTGFIHLSSVAVYGDPPSPESVSEDAACPRHDKESYAGLKARQDEMVIKAARRGLPSAILCPPNISGPCSYFLLDVLKALRSRQFALLEDGSAPCVLVDVQNLCHAIELALDDASTEVQRLFVTDDEDTTWRQVVEGLLPLLDSGFLVESTSQLALSEAGASVNSSSFSIVRSLKHLVSSSVREALRNDPLWARVDRQLRKSVTYLGSAMEEKLRLAIEGNLPVPRPPKGRTINANLCAQQLRGVRHSCAKAKKSIGYQPVFSFADSMEAFRRWYQATRHMNSAYWDLLKRLHQAQEG
jgi:nucleoside-diphosphate-sugar epimerase